MLPISHDEVVHGKRSLIGKMPGDEWRKFANARAFLAYMYGHPGKKLLFMGCEIGQNEEWNHDKQLAGSCCNSPSTTSCRRWSRELNRLYRSEPALYEVDYDHRGFEWIDFHDVEASVIVFASSPTTTKTSWSSAATSRPGAPRLPSRPPQARLLPRDLQHRLPKCSAAATKATPAQSLAEPGEFHGRPASARVMLPPLGVVVLKPEVATPSKSQNLACEKDRRR